MTRLAPSASGLTTGLGFGFREGVGVTEGAEVSTGADVTLEASDGAGRASCAPPPAHPASRLMPDRSATT